MSFTVIEGSLDQLARIVLGTVLLAIAALDTPTGPSFYLVIAAAGVVLATALAGTRRVAARRTGC